ncbi:unnamed protein product, partial [Rotaria sp. Silwood2]
MRRISASCICSRCKALELKILGEGAVVIRGVAKTVESSELEDATSETSSSSLFELCAGGGRGLLRERSVIVATRFAVGGKQAMESDLYGGG